MVGPTTDHEEIKRWASARGAVPVEVQPRKFDSEPAILRFLFGDPTKFSGELKPITWEQFFALFDLMGLSLVYDGDHRYELLQIEARSSFRFEGKPT